MGAETPDEESRVEFHGLKVSRLLQRFVDGEVLRDTAVDPDTFWSGLADVVADLGPRNRQLLGLRSSMQTAIDRWHRERADRPHDSNAYERFLRELGYIVEDGPESIVETHGIDVEIADLAGPQLVVPVTNARYAINAVNARWGSLYDALYGTDAMGDIPGDDSRDLDREKRVIAWARDFLDDVFPLQQSSHDNVVAYRVLDGALSVEIADGSSDTLSRNSQFAGHVGQATAPSAILLRNHGLMIEIVVDRNHAVGGGDPAGVSDILLESAVTVIMDLEDAVATVDAEDKVMAYRNWLGLMRGDLATVMEKDGITFTRRMVGDREYTAPNGGSASLPGRSLMLIRNVGNHLVTDAVLGPDGLPIPEGFLDAMITVACALPELDGKSLRPNSAKGSMYVVKPKLHGPEEVEFTDHLFSRVEEILGLESNTVKLGIMDEERRTSVNLNECIRAVSRRIAFINTGFLDRTGSEIHTSMEAGPMVRKSVMKSQPWIRAYEERNVGVGLASGLPGKAQIGKGMWAAPERMEAMLAEKISQPRSGANTAWVPSPTAATLHATHYHRVDVAARQVELAERPLIPQSELLVIPLDTSVLPDKERLTELENNAQSILGYVVRWVDQGVGSSKVPDMDGVELMEDRATCRISSQHMANWLLHGKTTREEVLAVMRRMAAVVDHQNSNDPTYEPMAPRFDGHAFRAAVALVLEGRDQPDGYIEPVLYPYRKLRKTLLREQGYREERRQ